MIYRFIERNGGGERKGKTTGRRSVHRKPDRVAQQQVQTILFRVFN